MTVGEIYDVIQPAIPSVVFKIVKKMLEDEAMGKISIPSSRADIEKAKSICQTIENSKGKKISGPQDYYIKYMFAEAIGCYYNINCKQDVEDAYIYMQDTC